MTTKRPGPRKPPPRRTPLGVPLPPDDYDVASGLGNEQLDEEVVIVTVEDGHSAMLPRSALRLPPHVLEAVKDLQHLAVERYRLALQIDGLVDELRQQNVSWATIGWSVGMTGEASRQRWGAPSKEPS